jgi:hypothetical protein
MSTIRVYQIPRTPGDKPIREFSDFAEAFVWARQAAKTWSMWLELHRPDCEPALVGPRL